eukprot:3234173-Prymnesium_polylepis.2
MRRPHGDVGPRTMYDGGWCGFVDCYTFMIVSSVFAAGLGKPYIQNGGVGLQILIQGCAPNSVTFC